MNSIETQIVKLFRDIPYSERKEEIMQEITQNLNEKVADLISQGHTESEAVKKAIEDFGDVKDIRKELVSSARLEKNRKLGLALAFSVWGAILISALIIFINLYYTPSNIWFVYPVFAVIWWPMSIYFHWLHLKTGHGMALPYSLASFALIIAMLLFINFYYTPHTIWFVYPTFAVAWWPLAMTFVWLHKKNRKDDCSEQES